MDQHPHFDPETGQPHTPDPGGRPSTDPAQESLSQALRFGFNILGGIMVVLLIAYVASGVFQVNPGEQGLIVRFGRLVQNTGDDPVFGGTHVFGPGWHSSWPEPIDEKIRISGASLRLVIESFLFSRKPEDAGKPLSETVPSARKFTPGTHGMMISGDRNLSHGLWTVEYRIEDAEKFVRSVSENPARVEPLLRAVVENAVVRVVAGLPVERIILREADEGGLDFVPDVQRLVNAELERLGAGVVVTKVTAETVEPGVVRQAFLDVTKAQNERESSINEARQKASRTLNESAGRAYPELLAAIEEYGAAQTAGADEARLAELRSRIDRLLDRAEGAVAKRLSEAQSRANEIRERVRLEYKQFIDYLSAYRQYPQLTAVRLWVRMRQAVLDSKQNEVFFVPESGEIEILTNRDPMRLIEADIERYQRRYEQPSKP